MGDSDLASDGDAVLEGVDPPSEEELSSVENLSEEDLLRKIQDDIDEVSK